MPKVLSDKTVAIVVAHEFEDVEVLYPILRLSEEGIRVLVVPVAEGLHPRPQLAGKPVTGRFGHTIPIPVFQDGLRYNVGTLADVRPDTVDALLFPGGYSPDALRLNRSVLELVRRFDREGKLVTAICHGPWVLVSAGVLAGKKATGYAAVWDDMVNAGATHVDVPAVRDGNIITGRVPDDLPEFCQEIIRALCE